MNAMIINYVAEHTNTETGEKFVNVWGSGSVEGKYLEDTSILVNADPGNPVYAVLAKLAAVYEAAKEAGRPQDYPRGFALDAPAGWACDWDQVRKPFTDGKGRAQPGRWKVVPLRGDDGTTIRLVKAPPPRMEVDAEAAAALKAAGLA